ncbi:MAG TPA: class I SAM-dependent methyltransferase, partial [Polyangiaceae bacterium]|nr:class I SAM-dependent methyltransferase [Polyangiaceae bacterium]
MFYVDRAEQSGGPVLEYGCGNGRILIPTARAGIEITGVDLSDTMLADLERRLADEPRDVRARVTVKKGDMRSLALRKKFALVTCPFNAFLHLYERSDIERFLARVKAHLAPKGRFLFDISVPDA